jgi:nucleotide-binding universal stress UspA family protein
VPARACRLAAELSRCAELLSSFVARGGGAVSVRHVGPHTDVRDFLVDLSESGLEAAVGPPALIIMAARGVGARSLRRLVLGSVTEYVAKAAATSLCIVPPLTEDVPAAVPTA